MMPGTRARVLPAGTVDSHAHVMRTNVPLDPQRHSAPARDVSVDEYLAVLDAHGVRYGLLTAPSFYGTNNAVLLDGLRQAGGRLRGTAIVAPDISEAQLAAMQAQGICGLRFNWVRRAQRPDIASAPYRALLSKARNLGLHIEVYLEGEHLQDVLQAAADSGVRLVVDHFGNPPGGDALHGDAFKALLRSVDAGGTWVKLSAPYRLRGGDARELARAVLALGNGERAVWATDWPWVGKEDALTYAQCIDWLFDWIPDDAMRHRVLVSTPQALFGFGDAAGPEQTT